MGAALSDVMVVSTTPEDERELRIPSFRGEFVK
jgi:hypothetical protein